MIFSDGKQVVIPGRIKIAQNQPGQDRGCQQAKSQQVLPAFQKQDARYAQHGDQLQTDHQPKS